MRFHWPHQMKAQRALEPMAASLGNCNKVEAGKGKGTEPSNENAAAIVMAIEMKVAASWPAVLLSSSAIWPVGLLVTSSKFACNRNGSGNSLCVLCVCACVCGCGVFGVCWRQLQILQAATSTHTHTHTPTRGGRELNFECRYTTHKTKQNYCTNATTTAVASTNGNMLEREDTLWYYNVRLVHLCIAISIRV